MALFVGIIGLPNVGKSTLFNALTGGHAEASNYPFCTVDPNVGVVAVPDPRLRELEAALRPQSCTPTTIRFVDIAGLVRGASRGEGLGNRFLGHVREADALVHVLRCFVDQQVAHVEGSVDPLRDAGTVEAELMLADLETVERALPRLDKVVHTDPHAPQRLELEALHLLQAGLQRGTPARKVELVSQQRAAVRGYHLLTEKPVLYAANVAEGDAASGGEAGRVLAAALGEERVLAISAQIESELAQLPPSERPEFLADLGMEASGVERLVAASYRLLDLITFYTVAHDKLQAWQLPRGLRAPEAAGRIHADMESGFIRAEVAGWTELLVAGGASRLREAGQLRTEGRDYVVQDGDVVHFLFR
ncbi:MAG: redox-regulated ATPase YchF [Candidatus Latescibacterota bacterium]